MRLVLVLALLVLAACPTTTPAASEVLCGTGTTLQGSTCVATSTGATCGAGTVLSVHGGLHHDPRVHGPLPRRHHLQQQQLLLLR